MAENCLDSAPWDAELISSTNGQYYDLGEYLLCAIPKLWGYAQIIFVTMAIIIVMRLIYKMVTNRDNTTVLEEVQKQWPYVILLAIVAIGGGGTFLNIALKFFGFGGVEVWFGSLSRLLIKL